MFATFRVLNNRWLNSSSFSSRVILFQRMDFELVIVFNASLAQCLSFHDPQQPQQKKGRKISGQLPTIPANFSNCPVIKQVSFRPSRFSLLVGGGAFIISPISTVPEMWGESVRELYRTCSASASASCLTRSSRRFYRSFLSESQAF